MATNNLWAAGPQNIKDEVFEGDIPLGAANVTLRANRSAWRTETATDVMQVMAKISYDGGATWGTLLGFTAAGGDFPRNSGDNRYTESRARCEVPQPGNAARKYRITVSALAQIDTEVNVDWE